MYVQQIPVVAPLVSEVAISEPEFEIEAPAEHDLTSTEESLAPEPETSYPIEETPAAIDHSLLAESGSPDDVNQSEATELQSELEPSLTEAEHMFSPVEDKTDVADASDSAPILATAQQLPEVAFQEIYQSQSSAVPEDVLDNNENQVEIITSSTKLEGDSTAENIEAKDFVVQEVDLICLS
jgi:hypothetical protein